MNAARSLLALLLLSGIAQAADDPVKRLETARMFAFGGVGIAGITTEEEIAFRAVLDSKTAEADFLRVLDRGTPAGKCYALVGLRLKNRSAFDERVARFAKEKAEVETAAGCMIAREPMFSVAANIRAGRYDQQAQRELKRLPRELK